MPLPVQPAFHVTTATEAAAETNQINSLTAPGWTSYTATWRQSVSAPTLGTGTTTGQYRRSSTGDVVDVRGRLLMGSTSSFGSGIWFVDLPSAALPSANSIALSLGTALAYDVGVQAYGGVTVIDSSGTKVYFVANGTGQQILDNTRPFTFANGDYIQWSIRYEPA